MLNTMSVVIARMVLEGVGAWIAGPLESRDCQYHPAVRVRSGAKGALGGPAARAPSGSRRLLERRV